MKVKLCPKCGSVNLIERWTNGRMFEQLCDGLADGEECDWKGEPYTPTKRSILNTTQLRIANFPGWHYIVYDKYGHVQTDSATHDTRVKAVKEIKKTLAPKVGFNDPSAPLTAVLFKVPARVTIQADAVFKQKVQRTKFNNGKVITSK